MLEVGAATIRFRRYTISPCDGLTHHLKILRDFSELSEVSLPARFKRLSTSGGYCMSP